MPKAYVNNILVDVTDEDVLATQYRSNEDKESEVRSERDNKLQSEVDVIAGNALRWAALSSDKQAEWATYRTALLDVPQQAGFPDTITWPTKP